MDCVISKEAPLKNHGACCYGLRQVPLRFKQTNMFYSCPFCCRCCFFLVEEFLLKTNRKTENVNVFSQVDLVDIFLLPGGCYGAPGSAVPV